MVLSMSSRRKLITSATTSSSSNSNSKPGRKFVPSGNAAPPPTANGKSKFVGNGKGGSGGSSSSSSASSFASSVNSAAAVASKDKKLSDITHASSSKANKLNQKHANATAAAADGPSTSGGGGQKSSKMLKTSHPSRDQAGSRLPLANGSSASSAAKARVYDDQDERAESPFPQASAESLRLHEEMYDQRIRELKGQLESLRKMDILPSLTSDLLMSLTKTADSHESKCGLFNYVEHYIQESARLERDSKENLTVLKAWYERQREQLRLQFETEHAKTQQEFQDRQKELKENLLNEYEEMRRQLETDKTVLDINLDVTDTKPAPTRKLRRRMNANNFDGVEADLVGSSYPQLSSVASAASVILERGIASGSIGAQAASSSSAVGGVGVAGSVVSLNVTSSALGLNQYSSTTLSANFYGGLGQPSYFSSLVGACSLLNSSLTNERKRKTPTAITFNLNDDEIGEDAKFLARNLNNYNFS